MTVDTLWYSYCPGPNAVGIAGHLGWLTDEFAPDGITVRTLASSPAPSADVRDAHQLVPKLELFGHLLRHGGNPPPLVALSKGVDIRIVGLTWTESTRRVLAFEESGIRTPADLAGRRLALPRRRGVAVDYLRSVTLRTYSEALASAGLTLDDVELVEIDSSRAFGRHVAAPEKPVSYTSTLWGAWTNASSQREELLALARGEIDALASEHAQAAHLQATLSLHTVFDTFTLPTPAGRASGDQPLVLTVDGALLRDRPDLIARWIARSLDAADWARVSRSKARRFIAADAGLPEELIDVAYSPEVHEQLGIDLDDRSLEGLQVQHDHLLAHGFLPGGGFEIERFVDRGPLAEAQKLRDHGIVPVHEPLPAGA
jgi:ABC-type nitrate/sulfonate/bicarbonate transport system substrate-binding protein